MPRKLPAIPVYEIPTEGGTLRLKLVADRRHVEFDYSYPQLAPDQVRFLLSAAQWGSLCDLRDTLMPKRTRKPK